MKAIMQSIRPKWCELIANGKKTIEVRKTRPKIDPPFKVYMYCTKDGDALCPPHLNCARYSLHRANNGTINGRRMTAKEREETDYQYVNGKVIGEYICDSLIQIGYNKNGYGLDDSAINGVIAKSCIEEKELYRYLKGEKPYLYHISELVIYDKPKELGEFYVVCKCNHCDEHCSYVEWKMADNGEIFYDCRYAGYKPLTRPPQDWFYVEELT